MSSLKWQKGNKVMIFDPNVDEAYELIMTARNEGRPHLMRRGFFARRTLRTMGLIVIRKGRAYATEVGLRIARTYEEKMRDA